jgi:hypothetical protein
MSGISWFEHLCSVEINILDLCKELLELGVCIRIPDTQEYVKYKNSEYSEYSVLFLNLKCCQIYSIMKLFQQIFHFLILSQNLYGGTLRTQSFKFLSTQSHICPPNLLNEYVIGFPLFTL